MVIPIFESEREHTEFITYVRLHKENFKLDVEKQEISEMFPRYAQDATTVIVYKFGKTLVQWLGKWRAQ